MVMFIGGLRILENQSIADVRKNDQLGKIWQVVVTCLM